MTPDLLREIGQLLHGADWKAPLAADLGVNERTVRRWAAGEWPVPDGIAGELAPVIERRIGELGTLSVALSRSMVTPDVVRTDAKR